MLVKTLTLSFLASVALASHANGGLHRRIIPRHEEQSASKTGALPEKHASKSPVPSLASPHVPSSPAVKVPSSTKSKAEKTKELPSGRPRNPENGTDSEHHHHRHHHSKSGHSGDITTTTSTTRTTTLTKTVTYTKEADSKESAVAPESDASETPDYGEESEGEACAAPVLETVTLQSTVTHTSTVTGADESPVVPVKAPEQKEPILYPSKPIALPFLPSGIEKPEAPTAPAKHGHHGHHKNGTHHGHKGHKGHKGHGKKSSPVAQLPSSTPVSVPIPTSSVVPSYVVPSYAAPPSPTVESIPASAISPEASSITSAAWGASYPSSSAEADVTSVLYSVVPVEPVPVSDSPPARK